MEYFELLNKFKDYEVALIFYSLLNRIPIIISGDSGNNEINTKLANLIGFRETRIYKNDFNSESEYQNILEGENKNFNIRRTVFLCYEENFEKLINSSERFTQHFFKSWIIAADYNSLIKMKDNVIRKLQQFLLIYINSNKDRKFKNNVQILGIKHKYIDLNWELRLWKNFINHKNRIVREKNIFINILKKNPSYKRMLKIFNFSDFIDDIDDDLDLIFFKKQIFNFLYYAKKIYYFLVGLEILNFDYEVKEKKKDIIKMESTILSKFLSNDISLKRILTYIKGEWGKFALKKNEFLNLIKFQNVRRPTKATYLNHSLLPSSKIGIPFKKNNLVFMCKKTDFKYN